METRLSEDDLDEAVSFRFQEANMVLLMLSLDTVLRPSRAPTR